MNIHDIIGPAQPLRTERLPETTYRAMPRMNASTLVHGLRGNNLDPFAVKWAYENPSQRATNQDALDRGTLAHMMMLEPLEVPTRVARWTGTRRAGAEWEAFCEANEHRLIVRDEDYKQVQFGCVKAMESVEKYFSDLYVEHCLLWSEGDVRCKGRVDGMRPKDKLGKVLLLDLKTTERGIDDRSTDRTVIDMRYREKMAWYRRGICSTGEIDKYDVRVVLVFVQLTPPFGVNVKPLDSICLDHFEARMVELLKRTRDAIEHNSFAPMSIESAMGLTSWEQFAIDKELNNTPLVGAEQG